MKTFVNYKQIVDAIEYTNEHFFTKPYSISPMVDRWFNQLAILEMDKGTIVPLSGRVAREHMDIILDGKVVSKDKIELIFECLSTQQKYVDKREKEQKNITALSEPDENTPNNVENEQKTQKTTTLTAKEIEAKALYDDIVARGQSKLNTKGLKIKNIIHRPNHGLMHSVRAASDITTIYTYLKQYDKIADIKDENLARLQLMMVFSVVGRRDETGFKDENGSPTYATYRTTSGRAYRDYCIKNNLYGKDLDSLYRDAIVVELMGFNSIQNAVDREKKPEVFLDYIIEKESPGPMILMSIEQDDPFPELSQDKPTLLKKGDHYFLYGRSSENNWQFTELDAEVIHQANLPFHKKKLPKDELFDKVYQEIRSKQAHTISREQAIKCMDDLQYLLTSEGPLQEGKGKGKRSARDKCPNILFPKTSKNTADLMLDMMNEAHQLELPRCYSLYPLEPGGSESGHILEYYLNKTAFYDFKTDPDPTKLTAFFQLIRYAFDEFELTGQKATFGLLSVDAFEAQKKGILEEVKAISTRCKSKDQSTRAKLLHEAQKALEIKCNALVFETEATAKDQDNLLIEYRRHLIADAIIKRITNAPTPNYDKRMFRFQQNNADDHHKIATSLTNAILSITPIPGINPLPIVSDVTHEHTLGRVTVYFDTQEQAKHFQQTCASHCEESPDIISNENRPYSVEISESHYQQLKSEQAIEFKRVTVPSRVERESTLVDEQGAIEALNLIAHNKGLARLVSTTALGHEDHPDYDFLFRALEDPTHERFTQQAIPLAKWKAERAHYHDPRDATPYERTIDPSEPPDLRFQEPITRPKVFTDKTRNWTIREKQKTAKNTIYTKKMAHFLLPPHGKMHPFQGYKNDMDNYFPIGVLFDIDKVDLKNERYIWAENRNTRSKFWIRDRSTANHTMYTFLNARLNKEGRPQWNKQQAPILSTKLPDFDQPEALVTHVEQLSENAVALLTKRLYLPSDKVLNDFKQLADLQKAHFLKQLHDNQPAKQRVERAYDTLQKTIDNELTRTSSKYAISLQELVRRQQKTTEAGNHNEILASTTKAAVRALYASKDELFDRLNLAFHAIKIREKYQYHIPLLVLSVDKPPYYYTESMIRNDLSEAFLKLQENDFPFDESEFPSYELDERGIIRLDEHDLPIIQKDAQGQNIVRTKNTAYQKELLVNLFKMGRPELNSIEQLSNAKQYGITPSDLEKAISDIVHKMNIVGGLEREKNLMNQVFSTQDAKKRDAFFIRTVTLGHSSLVNTLLARKDFTPSDALLVKAMQLANTHHHEAIKDQLVSNIVTPHLPKKPYPIVLLPETQVLAAQNNALFDRLHLAHQAMQLKAKLGFQLPLVIPKGNTHEPYTKTQFKSDLWEAYTLIQRKQFPFDTTLEPVYETNAQGKIRLDAKKRPIPQKNKRDHAVKIPANRHYQEHLLLALFKQAIPELSHIQHLRQGKINKRPLDKDALEKALETLVNQLDLTDAPNDITETDVLNATLESVEEINALSDVELIVQSAPEPIQEEVRDVIKDDIPAELKARPQDTTLTSLISRAHNQQDVRVATPRAVTRFMTSMVSLLKGEKTEVLFLKKVNDVVHVISLDIKSLRNAPLEILNRIKTISKTLYQQGVSAEPIQVVLCRPVQATALRELIGNHITQKISLQRIVNHIMQAGENVPKITSELSRITDQTISITALRDAQDNPMKLQEAFAQRISKSVLRVIMGVKKTNQLLLQKVAQRTVEQTHEDLPVHPSTTHDNPSINTENVIGLENTQHMPLAQTPRITFFNTLSQQSRTPPLEPPLSDEAKAKFVEKLDQLYIHFYRKMNEHQLHKLQVKRPKDFAIDPDRFGDVKQQLAKFDAVNMEMLSIIRNLELAKIKLAENGLLSEFEQASNAVFEKHQDNPVLNENRSAPWFRTYVSKPIERLKMGINAAIAWASNAVSWASKATSQGVARPSSHPNAFFKIQTDSRAKLDELKAGIEALTKKKSQ